MLDATDGAGHDEDDRALSECGRAKAFDGEPQLFEKVVPGAGKREVQVDLEAFASGIDKILEEEVASKDVLLGKLGSYLHYVAETRPQATKEIREKFVDHLVARLTMFEHRAQGVVGLDYALRREFAHEAVGWLLICLLKGLLLRLMLIKSLVVVEDGLVREGAESGGRHR